MTANRSPSKPIAIPFFRYHNRHFSKPIPYEKLKFLQQLQIHFDDPVIATKLLKENADAKQDATENQTAAAPSMRLSSADTVD